MSDFTMSIDYTMFCGDEPVRECVHHATLNIEASDKLKEEDVLITMDSVLEDMSKSTDENKEGKVYHFGSLTTEELVDDAVKLFPIYLDKLDEKINIIFLKDK